MQYVRHMLETLWRKEEPTNQRRLMPTSALKRATFWMQDSTLDWIRSYAKVSRISQGALINAVIMDFQLRRLNMDEVDPEAYARMRRFVDALLGACPELKPAPFLRVAHGKPFRQADKSPK